MNEEFSYKNKKETKYNVHSCIKTHKKDLKDL